MDRALLLVDDEPNILSSLSRLFRGDKYKIYTANSGQEGIALLQMHQVGVIISDQRMPGMTGTEFLSRAKEIQPESVRMVLSGYTELNSIADAINRGAVFRFLTKPWEDEPLREQVREAFRHFELSQRNARLEEELRDQNVLLLQLKGNLEAALQSATSERNLGFSVLRTTQQLLDQVPVAIIGFDADNIVIVANQCAIQLFPQLCIGLPIMAALPGDLLVSVDPQGGIWSQAGKKYRFFKNILNTSGRESCILTLIEAMRDTP